MRRRMRAWFGYVLFLSPALLLFVGLVLAPIALATYYSAYNWNGVEPLTRFVGLANYQRAISDKVLVLAFEHNLFLAALSLVVQLPFSLLVALAVNGRFRGRSLFRLIFFAPFVLSEVVTAVLFSILLQPASAVDQILGGLGLGGVTPLWLADRSFVLITVFLVLSWKYFGFNMIILLAGLQGIPSDVEEAAAIDGAGSWQAFRNITLPLLGPTLRIVVFLEIIGSLQVFDVVYVMTLGGPSNASTTMAYYMIDRAFGYQQFGYASAVAIIITVIALTFSFIYQRYALRRDLEGAVTHFAG
jgi:raffinose/stachyose/melibiose transport system permease protein